MHLGESGRADAGRGLKTTRIFHTYYLGQVGCTTPRLASAAVSICVPLEISHTTSAWSQIPTKDCVFREMFGCLSPCRSQRTTCDDRLQTISVNFPPLPLPRLHFPKTPPQLDLRANPSSCQVSAIQDIQTRFPRKLK